MKVMTESGRHHAMGAEIGQPVCGIAALPSLHGFGGLNSGYQAHRQALDLLSDHTGPVTKTLTHTTPCPSTQESCKKVAFGTNWNKLEMDQMCGSRQTLKVKTEHLRLFEPL